MGYSRFDPAPQARAAWNAGKTVGTKRPLTQKQIWAIRFHLDRAINHPDDVLHHPLLGPDHRPEFWQEWLRGVELDDQSARPREIDALLLYERALGGAGVAIGIEPLISTLLCEGRLKALVQHRLRSARSFFLVEPAETRTRAARLFRGWLQGEAQS